MKNILLFLLLAAVWSSSFGAIKIGVETIAPQPLVAGRMIIGAIIMVAILKIRGMNLSKNPSDWIVYAVSGLMGSVIPFFLISYGEIHVDSGLAAIMMGATPVAIVLFAPLVLKDEILTPTSLAGIALGVVGLVFLFGPSALSGIGEHVIGQTSIFLAALCYAFTAIYVRRYAKLPAMEMAAGSMLVGAIAITISTIIIDLPYGIPVPSLNSIAAMVYLGLFSTALANLIYFYLVAEIGATRISQINFAVPIGGALIGIFVLGEALTTSATLALCAIIAAIFLVTSSKTSPTK